MRAALEFGFLTFRLQRGDFPTEFLFILIEMFVLEHLQSCKIFAHETDAGETVT